MRRFSPFLIGLYTFFDTSNNYGFGRDEARIGAAISDFGGLPNGVVLSTKLDGNCRRQVCPAERTFIQIAANVRFTTSIDLGSLFGERQLSALRRHAVTTDYAAARPVKPDVRRNCIKN